ncbi:Protein of unknown function [Methylobacterium phyllostachyos]|uniref:DUF4007 domain-containing protein n=1 Tax=Methylobacterium phyllostachyos TaxID=582672 RepID=A0A1G9V2P2_9HYPH|nr:DUF4007 family protein [Methylobacterium phyllostachyos]SDM66484.1 Protein of unknown function [Methylobacterium phyllostachyos]
MVSPATVRYRYGRHETFAVRYGWLTKAAYQVEEQGGLDASLETADELGLGSKMIQSLQFWVEAMGLVQTQERAAGATERQRLTDLGALVWRHDRYLEYPATWWFLHMELCSAPGTVWSWFFNEFEERHFDRNACVDAFLRHTREKAQNPATPAVAQKDVACLLAAYAAPMAAETADPEDGVASPLRELGLILRHDQVHRFERVRAPFRLPPEAFLAAASKLASVLGKGSLSLEELARRPKGPGRLLCLGFESLDAAVEAACDTYWKQGVRTELLGAERHLLLPAKAPVHWLKDHYRRLGLVK